MARFPGLGSVVSRKIKDSDIEVCIRLVQAKDVRMWLLRMQKQKIDEIRRLSELRKGLSKEQAPEFWEKDFITPEGFEAAAQFSQDVLSKCLVSVKDLFVGDVDVSKERDVVKLISLLEQAGLVEEAASIAIEAQSPKAEQVFCVAS